MRGVVRGGLAVEPTRRRAAAAVIVPVLAAALGGCSGRSGLPPRSASVLLITIDTLRADHVGCYGASFAATPALDRLAGAGARFDQAEATAPVTLPSHASILTGRYPPAHGVRNNGMYALPASVPTLAEAMRQAGRRTGAFVSAYPVAAAFGLGRGFEVYDDRFGSASEDMFYAERRGGETVDAAAAWVRSLPADAPFFCWVHLFDPHANYDPPAPFSTAFSGRPYDGEIAYADSCVARLLDLLEQSGRASSTIVLATADHGEGLGEHGEATHGLFLYESTLRVPLVLSVPALAGRRFEPGRVIRNPVSLADVAPTLCDLTGAAAPAGMQGRSLVSLLEGGGPAGPDATARDLYAETLMTELEFGWAPLEALRRGSLKWIRAPRPELYDLEKDPAEAVNLAGTRAEASALGAALETLRARISAPGVEEHSRRQLSPQDVARLQSLGYVAGAGGAPGPGNEPSVEAGGAAAAGRNAAGAPQLDPKDGLPLLRRLEEGKELARSGRMDEAIAAFRAVLAEEPGNLVARWRLAETLIAANQPAEAERALGGIDDSVAAAYWVSGIRARARQAQGDVPGAIALYRVAVEREPDPSDSALRAGVLLKNAGQPAEASRIVEAAIARGATRASLFELAGDLAAEAGDPGRADAHYREAVRRNPTAAEVWGSLARTAFASPSGPQDAAGLKALAESAGDVAGAKLVLGLIAYVGGRPADAVAPLRSARSLDPQNPDVAYFLGLSLMDSGDLVGAEGILEPLARTRPEMFQAQRALGLLRERQGRRNEAVALLQRTLSLKPGDGPAREALSRLGGTNP